ncbi:MAG: retropepsin-like aspartic protease [Scytonema sp. PMC 1069.18]|nr:retropepsin-like aspartic protease [Scytonema sp. PMC 1069.18]MEC4882169.1 retropepsin-like aspartic protease [Scytonema sp. PMC 1070.18]
MEIVALLILFMIINIHYPRVERQARIKRRYANTPVIDVTFDGEEKFEMIVDTGASCTQINKKMANALKVEPQGKGYVILADGSTVEVEVGKVKSIEAGGIKTDNSDGLIVLIGGSEKDPGLLGQNFYKDYKVIIDRDSVEFRR